VGAPNSGKTTLYNWLTGSRFKTVNYPGATVEYSIGSLASHLGDGLEVMDTPGVYSLHPKSADEEVTLKALFEGNGGGPVDGVIVVVDGTQLERHLAIVLQIRETGLPFMVAVTMADLLRKENLDLDFNALSEKLQAPVVAYDGLLAGGLKEIVNAAKSLPARKDPRHPIHSATIVHAEASKLAKIALSRIARPEERMRHLSANTLRWDRVLLHPFFGLIIFFGIMSFLFSSIYWMATPFMDWIDGGFSGLAGLVIEYGGEGLLPDFIANGLIASFGAVLVFVPQIFILFFGIGILESSGYLARAATLIDRPFSAVGLTGRSFVPILSGFSCAVPAMIATRNISSRRDRWITNFVIPLMTCSARLPVYALLLGFVFRDDPGWKAGISLAALYFGALVVGGIAASILNRLIPKDQASILLMELPLYRRPRITVILRQALTRTMGYVQKAGPIILVIAILMWWGTNFPNYDMPEATAKLEQSYAGQAGKWIEPIFTPMGVDWRVGVGLISAFAAREVFVATMAVTFNVASDDEESQTRSLLDQMKTATRSDGQKIFTISSVIGLLIFFMIALQCMSTFAVARKEASWSFAIWQLAVFNLVAYVLAVIAVQGLRVFGVG
jgi:ferrous iron transport protein B